MMDLEDRRVTIVAGEDHAAVRVEAVVTGEISGGILRMETPDPDILDMDGAVVGMEYFYNGIFLRTTGELEIKVSGPSPYIFVLSDLSYPVEIQRRNWVRAYLEVDAAVEFNEESYLTRTMDISAGGARLKPIRNDAGLPAVNHGDEVMAVIYLPAEDPLPVGAHIGTRAPTRRGVGSTGGFGGIRGARSTGVAGVKSTSTMTDLSTGNPARLPSRVLQSDRKVLRLMFTVVSESAAKALTRAVFDAQVVARRRNSK